MLGHNDGDNHEDGVSYLELAGFLIKNGANVEADLEELWRRIVFYICVKNTDDHLRNHGFLLTSTGWKLSPAYDINPVRTGRDLKLNISMNDNSLDLELAKEVREYFRVSGKKANEIINKVAEAVAKWKQVAKNLGISNGEIEMMRSAFEK